MATYSNIKKLQKLIINGTILLIVLSGAMSILLSCNVNSRIFSILLHLKTHRIEILVVHKTLYLVFGIILLLLSHRLYKRMKIAWILTILTLSATIALKLFRLNYSFSPITIINCIVLFSLVLNHKEFNKDSDQISLKLGITIAIFALSIVFLNTVTSLFFLKNSYKHIHNLGSTISKTIQCIIYMDISILGPKNRGALIFSKITLFIDWASIFASLFFILKPLIYTPFVTSLDKKRVSEYLELYSHNPISYLCLEDDKKYFFSDSVDGVIAYTRCGDVLVCCGDPICRTEDVYALMSEFIVYCKNNKLNICMCQITDKYFTELNELGFGFIKYGEEAMFNLNTYHLTGKETAKVRQNVRRAEKDGIVIKEYKPLIKRDYEIEAQIENVSSEWLTLKKSSELKFMLGSTSLDNPMERRYFLAYDSSKQLIAFVVFVPFLGKNGYYADVTRRRKNISTGVMEKIIVTAFRTMEEEGVEWASLGLCPLLNVVSDENTSTFIPRVLDFVYRNFNQFYGFKSLYQYKKKYAPTDWETRFVAYYPNVLPHKIGYALVKAQNPGGISDYIFSMLRQFGYKRL